MTAVMAVVQARMASSRLPGKVLEPVLGTPMIVRQLERLARCSSLSDIVVAMSTDPQDDGLEDVVRDAGWEVIRGPQDDVLGRFTAVLDARPSPTIARLTADCPLISPGVVDLVVEAFESADVDYLSNTLEPSYPDGLDVEVMRTQALQRVATDSTDPHEREHVTLGIYRRPDRYRVRPYVDPSGRDHSDLRWTVDNADDLAFVRRIYAALLPTTPQFEYDDVLRWLQQNPESNRTNKDAPRNAALDGLDTGVMRHPGNQGSHDDFGSR